MGCSLKDWSISTVPLANLSEPQNPLRPSLGLPGQGKTSPGANGRRGFQLDFTVKWSLRGCRPWGVELQCNSICSCNFWLQKKGRQITGIFLYLFDFTRGILNSCTLIEEYPLFVPFRIHQSSVIVNENDPLFSQFLRLGSSTDTSWDLQVLNRHNTYC